MRGLSDGCRRWSNSPGFHHASLHSHGFVQIHDADYMLSIADRGADALAASGRIGGELSALKDEARRRVQQGSVLRAHSLRQSDRPQAAMTTVVRSGRPAE